LHGTEGKAAWALSDNVLRVVYPVSETRYQKGSRKAPYTEAWGAEEKKDEQMLGWGLNRTGRTLGAGSYHGPWRAFMLHDEGKDRRGPSFGFIGAAWTPNTPKWARIIEHQAQRLLVGHQQGPVRTAPVPSSPAVKPEGDMSTFSWVPWACKGAKIVVRLCI
jgi:hypothetical protein